jgi:hypothetical protein
VRHLHDNDTGVVEAGARRHASGVGWRTTTRRHDAHTAAAALVERPCDDGVVHSHREAVAAGPRVDRDDTQLHAKQCVRRQVGQRLGRDVCTPELSEATEHARVPTHGNIRTVPSVRAVCKFVARDGVEQHRA